MSNKVPTHLLDVTKRLSGPLKRYQPFIEHALDGLFNRAATFNSDGSVYISTGDISAMWLRDSSFQIKPLLRFSKDAQVYAFCVGVIKQQAKYINIDPYANAFNPEPNGNCWHKDFADQSPWVFERKWEIDSLASFLDVSYLLTKFSGRKDHMDAAWHSAAERALKTFQTELNHKPESYQFVRPGAPAHDHLSHKGYGAPFANIGLIWSGFRPSDDACELPFNIPQNAYAAASLKNIARHLSADSKIAAKRLAKQITKAIKSHGSDRSGYWYEIDGLGNRIFLDDANIPSLLSLPYLGFTNSLDARYRKTRRRVLSSENPWFFEGSFASHIGSPHTGPGRIWPLAMAMEIITSPRLELRKLEALSASASADYSFHESISADDPTSITREWFSWADMTFVDAVFTTSERLNESDADVTFLIAH